MVTYGNRLFKGIRALRRSTKEVLKQFRLLAGSPTGAARPLSPVAKPASKPRSALGPGLRPALATPGQLARSLRSEPYAISLARSGIQPSPLFPCR